jgi:predicted flavoprotein YhiN
MFGPREALEWFEKRGVKLKTEADGRMFPITDSSETIVECLREGAREAGVEVRVGWKVTGIEVHEGGGGGGRGGREGGRAALTVTVVENNKESHTLACDALLLATGSSKEGHALARSLGHTIVEPVPSLFTVELADRRQKKPSPLEGLAGISVACAEVRLVGPAPVVMREGEEGGGEGRRKEEQQQWKDLLRQAGLRAGAAAKSSSSSSSSIGVFSSTPTTTGPLSQRGPLLITHTGLSGPAILRLSAFAARLLSLLSYRASFLLDWLPESTPEDIHSRLLRAKAAHAKKSVATFCPLLSTTEGGEMIGEPRLPRRLWARLVAEALGEGEGGREGGGTMTWGGMTPKMVGALVGVLKGSVYESRGKSTHKEEFTTAGGVATKEVDFKTFASKKVEGVYFAGKDGWMEGGREEG